jgi:cytochrome c-type biogenesis protein CcmF
VRATIGYGALTAGAAAAALGIVTILVGVYKDRPVLLRIGRRYVFVTLMAAVAAFATMESALFAHDFSLRYVANNVARATPGLFTFTAAPNERVL